MNTPPLLLAAALLFWGRQTGLLAFAVPMALILEGRRLTAWRSPLTVKQFNRISDLCTVLFAALVAYAYSTRAATAAIMSIIEWMPLSYLPLLTAQAYSVEGKVDIGALFMSRRKPVEGPRAAFDLAYPYFIICVLSAGAANVRTPEFYAGMFALAAWSLWGARPGRTPAFAWAGLLLAAGGLGYLGQRGLHDLQAVLENKGGWLLFGSGEAPSDPNWSHTAIGRIGRLKQSDEIILRVTPAPGAPPPPLLRQASFDHYNAAQWFASAADFRPLRPLAGPGGWAISPVDGGEAASISTYLRGGKGILPLPTGAARVGRLAAAAVTRNRLGAVQVEDGPGFVDYDVRFAPSSVADAPPGKIDLDLPPAERPLLTGLAASLKLNPRRPREAQAAVARFFDRGFRYSLYQEAGKVGARPLRDFLLSTRSGHCEYFATATVLLLRAAGIPARYVTGYAVQERGRLDGSFVVRQRHGHAWALVYADGAWADLDTTPSTWAGEEARGASFFEPARDLLSWALFRFSRWRWREPVSGGGQGRQRWLFGAVLLGLAWKLWSELRPAGKLTRKARSAPRPAPPGQDSELYRLERTLAAADLGRRSSEPLSDWLDRLAAPVGREAVDALRPVVALHNRYRFDPAGLSGAERRELTLAAESWLARFGPKP